MRLSESEHDRVHIQALAVIRSRDSQRVYKMICERCLRSTHRVDSQRVRPCENSCNVRIQGEEMIPTKNVIPTKHAGNDQT